MKSRRRDFVKGISTLGAGALLPGTEARAQNKPAPAAQRETVASDARTVAETSQGKLRGLWRNGIFVFKGIPYGESTGGENRFMPPQPPQPWTGIRSSLRYGRACIQPASDSAHFDYDGHNRPGSNFSFLTHGGYGQPTPGEDCLRLNIWTPDIKNGRRPVMVFFHGGGFEGGSDQDLGSYDGESLARNDVVVVTCNHRLNLFGYLNLREVGGGRYTANAGLLDLVAVLKWVKDNIAGFGGDPGNVTIFGQSGGGGKVACLMAMPSAKGLFHRAIIQSGPYLRVQSRETSREITEEVLRQSGLSPRDVDQLQHLSVDKLVGAAAEAMKKLTPQRPVLGRTYGLVGWQPVVDGQILPRDPFEPDAPAVSANVPLLTGTIFNEAPSAVDREGGGAMTESELRSGVAEAYGAAADAIIAAYREAWPRATTFEIYGAIGAEPFRRAAIEQAARRSALGEAASYVYVYNWRTPMLDDRPGTFHACEIAFTFNNAVRCDQYSGLLPEALALERRIAGAWVAFARSGNPNHSGLPTWPAYRRDGATMVFGNKCEVRTGLEASGLALIAGHFP
jgi:para-nitrobenzyl esterase